MRPCSGEGPVTSDRVLVTGCDQRASRWSLVAGHGSFGQTMVELALVLPIVLLVLLGLLQFALYEHAQNVVLGSVQGGARVAAAEDRSAADGVAYAQALLGTGLGSMASVTVTGTDGLDTVVVAAHGSLQTIVPWFGGNTLPLDAHAVVSKERFRAGPGG